MLLLGGGGGETTYMFEGTKHISPQQRTALYRTVWRGVDGMAWHCMKIARHDIQRGVERRALCYVTLRYVTSRYVTVTITITVTLPLPTLGTRSESEGRLPSNVRWGTKSGRQPSLTRSSLDLPTARASGCTYRHSHTVKQS